MTYPKNSVRTIKGARVFACCRARDSAHTHSSNKNNGLQPQNRTVKAEEKPCKENGLKKKITVDKFGFARYPSAAAVYIKLWKIRISLCCLFKVPGIPT